MAERVDLVIAPQRRPRRAMRGHWDVETVAIPNLGFITDEAEALDWLLSPVRAE